MRFLLLLFIVIPIIEMWLLIKVGGLIGALPTIALVLLTAMVGLALLRQQGFSTLMRGRSKLESGELPAMEMIEGLVLAVSGALLLTPGFFTDALGFAGLLPFSRRWLVSRLLAQGRIVDASYHASVTDRVHREEGGSSRPSGDGGDTIEGEFRRED
ncbi:MAG TPA: biotin--acetyl-CoA-carboxylase ligase [Porticoccaceae bacterium]|nr:biotin--acetyl-CoA-carboxylase ligase [Porticoccaceae bacterium]